MSEIVLMGGTDGITRALRLAHRLNSFLSKYINKTHICHTIAEQHQNPE